MTRSTCHWPNDQRCVESDNEQHETGSSSYATLPTERSPLTQSSRTRVTWGSSETSPDEEHLRPHGSFPKPARKRKPRRQKPLQPVDSSGRRRRPGISSRPASPHQLPWRQQAWKWTRSTCAWAVGVLSLSVLAAVLVTLLHNAGVATKYDYSQVTFPWRNDPTAYLEPFDRDFQGPPNILLEGHAHTVHSDGSLLPSQVVEFYRSQGFNAAIVSDHNTVQGGLEAEAYAKAHYPGEFLVIPAQEYSCCRIHMNLINIRETIPVTKAFPSNDELKEVVDRVHRLGGLVVINHIPWSNRTEKGFQVSTLPSHPTREELLAMGVDGIEVMNGNVLDVRSYQLVRQNPLRWFQITGNDMHQPNPVHSWTVLKSHNFTVEGIMEELTYHRTSFLVEPSGTRQTVVVPIHPMYWVWAPITQLAKYFELFYDRRRGMYSFTGSFCHPETVKFHYAPIMLFIVYVTLLVFSVRLAYDMLCSIWKNSYAGH